MSSSEWRYIVVAATTTPEDHKTVTWLRCRAAAIRTRLKANANFTGCVKKQLKAIFSSTSSRTCGELHGSFGITRVGAGLNELSRGANSNTAILIENSLAAVIAPGRNAVTLRVKLLRTQLLDTGTAAPRWRSEPS